MGYEGPMGMDWKSRSAVAYEGSCGYGLRGVQLSQYRWCGGVYRQGVTIQTSRGSECPAGQGVGGRILVPTYTAISRVGPHRCHRCRKSQLLLSSNETLNILSTASLRGLAHCPQTLRAIELLARPQRMSVCVNRGPPKEIPASRVSRAYRAEVCFGADNEKLTRQALSTVGVGERLGGTSNSSISQDALTAAGARRAYYLSISNLSTWRSQTPSLSRVLLCAERVEMAFGDKGVNRASKTSVSV